MQKQILAALAGLAIGWFIFSSTPTAAQTTKIVEWEYSLFDRPVDPAGTETLTPFLNEKGAGGWELCDVVSSRLYIFRRVKR